MKSGVLYLTMLFGAGCEALGGSEHDVDTVIVGGQPTTGYSGVVMIGRKTFGSEITGFCSGTLIDNRVVITAAHCLASAYPDSTFVGFGNLNQNGRTDMRWVGVNRTRTAAGWDDQSLADDVALIELVADAPPDVTRYRAATGVPSEGTTLTLVGFGRTAGDVSDFGLKREGRTQVTSVTSNNLISENWAPSGVCFGDSGGPAFADVGGELQLVGVTSFTGSSKCDGYGGWQRIDYHLTPFIYPFMTNVLNQTLDYGVAPGFTADQGLTRFVPIRPARILDTRGGAPLAAGEVRTLGSADPGFWQSLGFPGTPTSTWMSAVMISPDQAGFSTIAGSLSSIVTSTVNFVAGEVATNNFVTSLSGGAFAAFSSAATHAAFDVFGGFFPQGLGFTPIIDDGGYEESGFILAAGQPKVMDVAKFGGPTPEQVADAEALVVDVLGFPSAAGYLAVYPCDDASSAAPPISQENFVPGQVAFRRTVVVATGAGKHFCMLSSSNIPFVATYVVGIFGAKQPLSMQMVQPTRVLDTRLGLGGRPGRLLGNTGERIFSGGEVLKVAVAQLPGTPSRAKAVILNGTLLDAQAPFQGIEGATYPYATIGSCKDGFSGATSLTGTAGQSRATMLVVPLAPDGSICIEGVRGRMDATIDVLGFFVEP